MTKLKRMPSPVWIAALAVCGACARRSDPPPEAPAEVGVANAELGDVTLWLRLFGRTVPPPDQDATLAPQIGGVLLAVDVRQGQGVRAGQVVARIDPAPLDDALAAGEAAARRAAADADFRRRAANRTRGLFEKGISSREEAEADEAAAVGAEAALSEASAALASARRRRAWAEVRAPFDGVVLRVIRRAGEPVDGSPATAVLEIAAATPVQVTADATAAMLLAVETGSAAEIAATGAKQAVHRGRVVRVARAVDPATGAGEVRISLDERAAPLVLGTPVEVRIAVQHRQGVVRIPSRALRRSPEGPEVVVVVAGKAVVRKVTTGIIEGDHVEIVSGLAAGETLVVDDPVGLAEGAAISARR